MAKYILLTSCQVASQLFRYGEILDDQYQPTTRLLAAGAKIAWLPNAAVEDWAARLASQRARGSFDDQDPGYPMRDSIRQPFGATIDVDPVSGDDRSSGYSGSPIKTNVELQNRINNVDIATNLLVTHKSYPPLGTDPLRLDLRLLGITRLGPAAKVVFQGPPLTTKRSGLNVQATTPRVRSTNTPNAITNAVLDATDLTMRVRITGGARSGARCWLAKSLGAGAYRISEPAIYDPDPYVGQIQTPVILSAAAGGDPFVVEQASGCMMVESMRFRGPGANYGAQAAVIFNDYDLGNFILSGGAAIVENYGCAVLPYNCRFTGQFANGTINATSAWTFRQSNSEFTWWTTLENCCGYNALVTFAGDNLPNDGIDTGLFTEITVGEGAYAAFYNDVLVQDPITGGTLPAGIATDGGTLLIDALGIMDARSIAAASARENGRIILYNSFYGFGGYLWGTSASAVYGIDINDDGTVRYLDANKISLTGGSGFARMGNRTVAEPFDLTTRTYLAAVNLTLANLQNAGVSKDNLHDVTRKCSIRKSTGLRF